ncbi:hypothetical protein E5K00_11545 [Hymenobacter aquaticus]|uniref:DUF2490 domain-containing protein n=1 Tax=Hymenobacter aquaticus TaxID=1867101 RepID=A0A4Z0Q6T1_9BACT|nr:hypothetical protein [Hymenobacter aquaticus]TGE25790.1 hypothetical protein E5K00_11545 [Hymenobacter aquaticus]
MILRLPVGPSGLLLAMGLMGLGSCSVYAPMLPGAPQLRDKGQAEVQGTTFLNGRWEGAVTYSPVKHLLVRAAGGFKEDSRDTSYFRGRQYEVGLGGYYPLGQRWLVSGLGGFGQAVSRRGYVQPSLFLGQPYNVDFNARYNKYFGELALSYQYSWLTVGTAWRFSQVRFTSLLYNDEPLAKLRMTRLDPMLFMRVGPDEGSLHWLSVQLSGGLTGVPSSTYTADADDPHQFEYRRLREGQLFMALSVVLYPHRLLARPTR